MAAYRQELRMRFLLSLGVTDTSAMEDPAVDEAIAKIAGRVLSSSELVVFFYLFSGASWDEVLQHYNKMNETEIELTTILRYGKRSQEKLFDVFRKHQDEPEISKYISLRKSKLINN